MIREIPAIKPGDPGYEDFGMFRLPANSVFQRVEMRDTGMVAIVEVPDDDDTGFSFVLFWLVVFAVLALGACVLVAVIAAAGGL